MYHLDYVSESRLETSEVRDFTVPEANKEKLTLTFLGGHRPLCISGSSQSPLVGHGRGTECAWGNRAQKLQCREACLAGLPGGRGPAGGRGVGTFSSYTMRGLISGAW